MVEMELVGVRVEMPANVPIVVLREIGAPNRMLQIFIGAPEATAIAVALEGIEPRRPLTHDLIKVLFTSFDAVLDQVVITEIREGVFYAELHIATTGGTQTLSCRPSDALALSIRTGARVYVTDEVLNEAGYIDNEAAESEEVMELFRDFLDSVDPDDFGS